LSFLGSTGISRLGNSAAALGSGSTATFMIPIIAKAQILLASIAPDTQIAYSKSNGASADDRGGDDPIPRDTDGVLAESERAELVTFLGSNPEAGDIIAETGGVRKLRWAGARIGSGAEQG
jgi:hypothetical protein